MAELTNSPGALAVFVKTPELSPVKTRLARQIGAAAARAVYEHSLEATAAVMQNAAEAGVAVYWAVGEMQGAHHHRWRSFPVLFTGEGGLGERLHKVYSTLQKRHQRVALIGSDSPQLPPPRVLDSLQKSRGGTVIGPTADGGFYLFAATRRIACRVWTTVEYSRPDTLRQLEKNLAAICRLPPLHDIDDKASLQKVIAELKKAPLAAQKQAAQAMENIMMKCC